MPDPGEPPPDEDDVIDAVQHYLDAVDEFIAAYAGPAENEIQLQALTLRVETEDYLRKAAGDDQR